ncbi:hypothetical protein [Lysinibacillus xylanilyticus]|uniref:hypothetical protein n=1 Tax=Lysinibacillus xylanilyticus TaxID=582475 RepID=UPI00083CA0E5|nr:hypothetical protein [Lysinibacillus xylanilyticus]
MKQRLLRFSIIISTIILLAGSLMQAPTIHATAQQPIEMNEEDSVQARGAQVAIFFGGIVVAWITDGVISYKTGHAPSEWIAMGLSSIEQKIKNFSKNDVLSRPIQVSSNGQVSGCTAYPCMIQAAPEDETMDLEELLEPTPPEQVLE